MDINKMFTDFVSSEDHMNLVVSVVDAECDEEGEEEVLNQIASSVSTESNGMWQQIVVVPQEQLQQQVEITVAEQTDAPPEPPELKPIKKEENGQERVICSLCDKSFASKKSRGKHLRKVHNIVKRMPPKKTIHHCAECDKTFKNGSNLTSHVNAVHLNLRKFECPECSYKATSRSILQRHVVRKHFLRTTYELKKPFKCSACDARYTMKSSMRKHERSAHGIANYDIKNLHQKKCPLCSFASRRISREEIHDHFREVHNLPIRRESFKFKNKEAFLQWKADVEEATYSYYNRKVSHSKETKLYWLQCNRTGRPDLSRFKDKPPTLGVHRTLKMNAFCPAEMHYRMLDTGVVQIDFWPVHVGHGIDDRFLINANKMEVERTVPKADNQVPVINVARFTMEKVCNADNEVVLKRKLSAVDEDNDTWGDDNVNVHLQPDEQAVILNYNPVRPFKCSHCRASFLLKGACRKHERRVHGVENYEKKVHEKRCPECSFVSKKYQRDEIMEHFQKAHNIPIRQEKFKFNAKEEFQKWKADVEKETKTRFNTRAWASKSKWNWFSCNRNARAGSYLKCTDKRPPKRGSKSTKMSGFCPAAIHGKLLEDGGVEAVYWPVHVGHTLDDKPPDKASDDESSSSNLDAIDFEKLLDAENNSETTLNVDESVTENYENLVKNLLNKENDDGNVSNINNFEVVIVENISDMNDRTVIEEIVDSVSVIDDNNHHRSDNNVASTTTNKLYECEQCDFTTENKRRYKRHVIMKHMGPEPKLSRSEICVIREMKKRLKKEMMKRNGEEKKTVIKRVYVCDDCEKTFTNKISLRAHIEIFHLGFATCNKCDSRFTTKTELDDHQLREHPLPDPERPYKCSHCESSFVLEIECMRHVRRIHDIDNYTKRMRHEKKCPNCPFISYKYTRDEIHAHFREAHNIPLRIDHQKFDDFKSFVDWKLNVEKASNCYFNNKLWSSSSWLSCHRSGRPDVYKTRKNPRSEGPRSIKINAFCPAEMHVKKLADGGVEVKFWPEHVGHTVGEEDSTIMFNDTIQSGYESEENCIVDSDTNNEMDDNTDTSLVLGEKRSAALSLSFHSYLEQVPDEVIGETDDGVREPIVVNIDTRIGKSAINSNLNASADDGCKTHVRRARMVEDGSDKERFQCSVCKLHFASRVECNRHERRKHQVYNLTRKLHGKKCPECWFVSMKYPRTEIHAHLSQEPHCVPITRETHTFDNLAKFNEWKLTVERSTGSYYNTQTGSQWLTCNRSGHPDHSRVPVSEGIRSKKIGAFCPSEMHLVSLENGRIQVDYWPVHVGHECIGGKYFYKSKYFDTTVESSLLVTNETIENISSSSERGTDSLNVDGDSSRLNSKYNCDECKMSFNNKIDRNKHVQSTHLLEMRFSCEDCSFRTASQTMLLKHRIYKHTPSDLFKCTKCDSKFGTDAKRELHEKTCSASRSVLRTMFLKTCPLCSFVCSALPREVIFEHFKETHSVPIRSEMHTFDDVEAYLEWKVAVEKSTNTYYPGNVHTKSQWLNCSLRGRPTGKKVDFYCPSTIHKSVLGDGRVKVQFWPYHVGHEVGKVGDNCHSDSTSYMTTRSKVAAKSSSYPTDEQYILPDCYVKLEPLPGSRSKSVKPGKDILPQWYHKFVNSYDKGAENSCNEESSRKSTVSTTSMLHYKPLGMLSADFPELSEDDVVFIHMTDAQKVKLEFRASDVVFVDCAHHLNDDFNLKLFTLLVVDTSEHSPRNAYPAAFMLTNRADKDVAAVFFEKIKEQVGRLCPKVFMSDVENVLYAAWSRVMGPPDQHLLSTAHVLRAWKRHLDKIETTDNKEHVYNVLKSLLYERNKRTFHELLDAVIKASTTETERYYKYFRDNYIDNMRYKQWAHCYTVGVCGSNRDISFEVFDSVMKQCYLRGMKRQKLDTMFSDVLRPFWNRLGGWSEMVFERKMESRWQNGHSRSRHFTGGEPIKISENRWDVLSTTGNEFYVVKKINTCLTCEAVCAKCAACWHEYVCSCLDCVVHNLMCVHIHVVAQHVLKAGADPRKTIVDNRPLEGDDITIFFESEDSDAPNNVTLINEDGSQERVVIIDEDESDGESVSQDVSSDEEDVSIHDSSMALDEIVSGPSLRKAVIVIDEDMEDDGDVENTEKDIIVIDKDMGEGEIVDEDSTQNVVFIFDRDNTEEDDSVCEVSSQKPVTVVDEDMEVDEAPRKVDVDLETREDSMIIEDACKPEEENYCDDPEKEEEEEEEEEESKFNESIKKFVDFCQGSAAKNKEQKKLIEEMMFRIMAVDGSKAATSQLLDKDGGKRIKR